MDIDLPHKVPLHLLEAVCIRFELAYFYRLSVHCLVDMWSPFETLSTLTAIHVLCCVAYAVTLQWVNSLARLYGLALII